MGAAVYGRPCSSANALFPVRSGRSDDAAGVFAARTAATRGRALRLGTLVVAARPAPTLPGLRRAVTEVVTRTRASAGTTPRGDAGRAATVRDPAAHSVHGAHPVHRPQHPQMHRHHPHAHGRPAPASSQRRQPARAKARASPRTTSRSRPKPAWLLATALGTPAPALLLLPLARRWHFAPLLPLGLITLPRAAPLPATLAPCFPRLRATLVEALAQFVEPLVEIAAHLLEALQQLLLPLLELPRPCRWRVGTARCARFVAPSSPAARILS